MNRPQHIFSLEGKHILLTGATGHLGLAMAEGLGNLGARVFINGRSRERVVDSVTQLKAQGILAEEAIFDVNDHAKVLDWFKLYGDRPLHGIINNAYAGASGSIEYASEASYMASYDISVVAAHRVVRHALPALRRATADTGGASVVNIASMYGVVSPDQSIYPEKKMANPPFYGAAKAALIQWTRYAACEFGEEGIRVNCISPGPFPSARVQESQPEFVDRLARKVPLGRIGSAKELQGPVSFLISDASSYVNGCNLLVDGGWTCW